MKMKKVVTFGVYDYFHLGHLRLFKNAKNLGDWLIVAVQDGDYILKTKPDAKVMYTTEQRKELVSALRVVDEVVSYTDVDKLNLEMMFVPLRMQTEDTSFMESEKLLE